MGFPETADVARNFAVMVRVQGPDPKSLKMKNHAFHLYNSGKTMLSASGMMFPTSILSAAMGDDTEPISSDKAFVLTAASVIEPFLSQKYRENPMIGKPQLIPGALIDVLLEENCRADGNIGSTKWTPAELLMLVSIPESSAAVESIILASFGSSNHNWEVGWSLASAGRTSQQILENIGRKVENSPYQSVATKKEELQDANLMGQLTTRIAVLEIQPKFSVFLPKLQLSIPQRGSTLLAMGSPFGILSPLHFFNNISVGSIGNTYPPNSFKRCLLMVDIRCLPGMEGGPVFCENGQFIGILTRPLRQKISGAEIQIVIPWEAIVLAWGGLMKEEPHIKSVEARNLNAIERCLSFCYSDEPLNRRLHDHVSSSGTQTPSLVEKAMNSICLITTGNGSWASGVLLNKEGLVLTNAHLLEPWRFGKSTTVSGDSADLSSSLEAAGSTSRSLQNICIRYENDAPPFGSSNSTSRSLQNICVRLDFTDPWMWTDAKVVYISKGPLDVALLQLLQVFPDQLCPITMDVDFPTAGSKAFIIGHGLFGPRCDLLPSASLGVISKVIAATKSPGEDCFAAMLQTTAAVHPGSSGGAVVRSDGKMMGLVTSNAKHGGGTVIPHLNFSIPCGALEAVLNFSADMKDYGILEQLDRPDEQLSSVWSLMPP
ncbi:hypothetical protein M569_06453, partial [Genlisea aurea]